MKHTTSEGQTLHKIPEAAARLSVSRSTVYRLIAVGELDTVLVDTKRAHGGPGVTRIPSSVIDAYINRHKKAVAS